MFRTQRAAHAVCLLVTLALLTGAAAAQDGGKPEPGWHNSTSLSFVFTEGNADSETIGFENLLGKRWDNARFQLKMDATKSDTADDRFVQVESGITWLPGLKPGDPNFPTQAATRIVEPDVEPDVEQYFAEAYYDRDIKEAFSWRAGASWDRNEDAGILSRTIGFVSVGHRWRDTETLHVYTGYGLSYTDRKEETPDPEKENRFGGFRLDGNWNGKINKSVGFENSLTSNMSLADTGDYSVELINALAVSMTKRLKLRVSFRWLYNNEPALEDMDVVALFIVVDPDGIPGSGDEFFQTVDSGGAEIELGEQKERREALDKVLRVSLQINL